MAYELKDKVFFVTGAAGGIGTELVKLLVAEGAKVVAFDLNEKVGVALQDELNLKYGAKVEFIKGDVTNEEQFVGSLKRVKEEKGLDVLINNAGIMDDSWEKYKKEIEVNVTALITGTLHALKLMRKDEGGKGGAIINIASIAGLTQTPLMPIYWATKSAVIQFSSCIGREEYYSRTGVRIMTVCPGRTATELLTKLHSFDKVIEDTFEQGFEEFPNQKPEAVACSAIEVYKKGSSGSTWVAESSRPAEDITENIRKASDILYKSN